MLALIVGLSFLAGHPESSFDMALGTGLFAFFYILRQVTGGEYGDRKLQGALTRLSLWVGAYLLGALISAVQIFPAIEYILQSQVLAGRTTIGRMPATLDLPYMWTLISPDFFGNPAHHNVWLTSPTYEESNTYSGIGVLLLAPFAFLVKDRARRWLAFFLLFVGILAMGTIYHWPLIYDAVNLFPLVRSTATRRFIMFLPLVLGLLAAIGFDEILRRALSTEYQVPSTEYQAGPKRLALAARQSLLLQVGVALAALLVMGIFVPWAFSHTLFGIPLGSALANRVWSESLWRALIVLLATAAVLFLIILAYHRAIPNADDPGKTRYSVLGTRYSNLFFLLPLVIYADLWQARWDFNPTVAPEHYFPATQATNTLQSLPGPARTLGIVSLIQNTNLHYGISDFRGYDVIEPRLYRDVAVLVEPAVRDVPGGRVTTFLPRQRPIPPPQYARRALSAHASR